MIKFNDPKFKGKIPNINKLKYYSSKGPYTNE